MRWLSKLIQFRVEHYNNGPAGEEDLRLRGHGCTVTRHEWLGPFFRFEVLRQYEDDRMTTDVSFVLCSYDPRW